MILRSGYTREPEYRAWKNARERCANPTNERFPDYGGRGIVMCAAWSASFSAFLADMGPRPSPAHSLDRIDNDGPYSPENCRWATDEEQNNNRRYNRLVEIDGETLTVAQASKRLGIKHVTLLQRLDRGAPLTTPVKPRRKRARLTEDEKREIAALARAEPHAEVAAQFNVSQSTVSRVRKGAAR